MRADRLLSILLLLQAHGRATARELAERLEVSTRTIHRDMEALSVAGAPVYALRGAGGGWELPSDYRIDPAGLHGPEVQALFLAKPAKLLADLGLVRADDAGLIKLQAALPADHRRDAEHVRQRIHVDVAGWHRSEEAPPLLPIVQAAVLGDRRLFLRYGRPNREPSERTIDPLGLVAKGSVWYLIGGIDGEVRTYRVSRIVAAEPRDAASHRPPGFDLAAFWEGSKQAFVGRLPRYPVLLLAEPEAIEGLREASRWSRVERVEEDAQGDGRSRAWMRFERFEDALSCLLGAGPAVEALEPDDLRCAIVQRAEATLQRYRLSRASRANDRFPCASGVLSSESAQDGRDDRR